MNVFLLTYNEQDLWCEMYPDDFVNKEFKTNNINFIVLDNGNQPKMREWCARHNYIYYASEYNIGSAGGYNWIFKVARSMGLPNAILMQADVGMTNAQPLIITDHFVKHTGSTHFACWPQYINTIFWPHCQSSEGETKLSNLGNLVGFNPKIMQVKNCYFDDNYVVTHFDDMEFMYYLRMTKKFNHINIPYVLNVTNQYNSHETMAGVELETFNVKDERFHLKIHHASQDIDYTLTGEFKNHRPWYNFNKPYFDQVISSHTKDIFCENGHRMPYDPKRWTKFGYPPYPTSYEIDRFFKENPDLLKVQFCY